MKVYSFLCKLLFIFSSFVKLECATKNIKYGWIPIENRKYKSLENFKTNFSASYSLTEHNLKRRNYQIMNAANKYKLLNKDLRENSTSNSWMFTKLHNKKHSKKNLNRKFKRSKFSKHNSNSIKQNKAIPENMQNVKKSHLVQNFATNQVNNQGTLKPVIGANSNCFNGKKGKTNNFNCFTKTNKTKTYKRGTQLFRLERKACITRNKLMKTLSINKVPRRWITEVTTIMKNHQMSLLILPDEQEFLMHEGKSLIGFIGDTNIFYDDQMEIVKIAHITID